MISMVGAVFPVSAETLMRAATASARDLSALAASDSGSVTMIGLPLSHVGVHRDAAQEGHIVMLCHGLAAALAENVHF
jgi:hypothetical protein